MCSSNKQNKTIKDNYNGLNSYLGISKIIDEKIFLIQEEYKIYKVLNKEQKIIQKKYLNQLENELFEEIEILESTK